MALIKRTLSEDTKLKISNALKGRKLSEEHRKKCIESKLGTKNPMYGGNFSEEHRQRMSESGKSKVITEDHRKNLGIAKKKYLESLTMDELNEMRSKLLRSRSGLISVNEKVFNEFLQDNFPNEWKYVGNGDFMVEGKCPDFVNINGKKIVIEFYTGGSLNSTCGKRAVSKIPLYESYGYTVVLVAKEELKKKEGLIHKLKTALFKGFFV